MNTIDVLGSDDEDDDNLNDENVAVDLDVVDVVDVESLNYNLMYTHTLNARFQM